MDDWQEYFGHPEGSKLGILNSIYQIGSICSFPFAYVIDQATVKAMRDLVGLLTPVLPQPLPGRPLRAQDPHRPRLSYHDSRCFSQCLH